MIQPMSGQRTMLTSLDIMSIHQAVSTTALENGWDEAKRQEVFNQTVSELIKSQVKVSKKKRHRQ